MANEFDDIFKDAASRYRPEAPRGLWQRLSYELDAARGARKLNWVWPLRFAVSTIALVTVGLETIRNYDSMELPQPGIPVNYEELAIQMQLLEPLETDATKKTSSQDSNGEQVSTSTVRTTVFSPEKESAENTNVKLLRSVRSNTNKEKFPAIDELGKLTPNSDASLLLTPPLATLSFSQRKCDLKQIPTVSKSKWYVEIGGFAETSNLSLNPDYALSVYDYEDELFSYVPDENIRIVQNLTNQRMLNLVGGFKLSKHLHVYSGVRFATLSGTQTALVSVEEQFAYTVTRTYAGPAGFDRIQIEEEVVSATTVRDTIATRFTFSSWSIPLGMNFNLPVSKRFSVFVGPQVSLALGYHFESKSTSEKFEKLNNSVREAERFTPVAFSAGAAAGMEYRLTNNLRLSLTGEASRSSLISSEIPKSDEYTIGRLGLGLRYHF